jgi:hypothetical protein
LNASHVHELDIQMLIITNGLASRSTTSAQGEMIGVGDIAVLSYECQIPRDLERAVT